MADIKVDIPGLIDFKDTVHRNSERFTEIKQNLEEHLNNLRDPDHGGWETEGARDFDTVFGRSKTDIDTLVSTMKDFVNYLTKKIGQAEDIDRHKVAM